MTSIEKNVPDDRLPRRKNLRHKKPTPIAKMRGLADTLEEPYNREVAQATRSDNTIRDLSDTEVEEIEEANRAEAIFNRTALFSRDLRNHDFINAFNILISAMSGEYRISRDQRNKCIANLQSHIETAKKQLFFHDIHTIVPEALPSFQIALSAIEAQLHKNPADWQPIGLIEIFPRTPDNEVQLKKDYIAVNNEFLSTYHSGAEPLTPRVLRDMYHILFQARQIAFLRPSTNVGAVYGPWYENLRNKLVHFVERNSTPDQKGIVHLFKLADDGQYDPVKLNLLMQEIDQAASNRKGGQA